MNTQKAITKRNIKINEAKEAGAMFDANGYNITIMNTEQERAFFRARATHWSNSTPSPFSDIFHNILSGICASIALNYGGLMPVALAYDCEDFKIFTSVTPSGAIVVWSEGAVALHRVWCKAGQYCYDIDTKLMEYTEEILKRLNIDAKNPDYYKTLD